MKISPNRLLVLILLCVVKIIHLSFSLLTYVRVIVRLPRWNSLREKSDGEDAITYHVRYDQFAMESLKPLWAGRRGSGWKPSISFDSPIPVSLPANIKNPLAGAQALWDFSQDLSVPPKGLPGTSCRSLLNPLIINHPQESASWVGDNSVHWNYEYP